MTTRRRRRAVAALVAGIVLTALGVGVGLSSLAAGGLGATSLLGLLVLLIGVVLLVGGVVGLVRATPGWWRLLAAPGVVVLALVSVYVLAVALRAAVPARDPAPDGPPAGVAVQDVVVPTGGGEQLAGWYVPSRRGAALILLPGSSSTRAALVDHLRVLAGAGYGVLALDPRGQGGSTGRAMDWGWFGDEDVPAAVTYLAGRADVDPRRLAVVGLSMGGEQAIGAAGVDPRIRAVVAEGVTGRGAADLPWLSDAYGWRGTLTEGIVRAQTTIADVLSPASPPPPLRAAAAAAAPRPILLLAAGQVPDEQHAAAHLEGAGADNVDVWVVRGAGHTAGLGTDPAGWTDRVLRFLDAGTA